MLDALKLQPGSGGLYDWAASGPGGPTDLTASYYAVGGAYALSRGADIEAPQAYWQRVARTWEAGGPAATDWATWTGEASADDLAECAAQLATLGHVYEWTLSGNPADERARAAERDRALTWLGAQLKLHAADLDPEAWCRVVEAARLTGGKYIGAVDWARAGAAALLAGQNADGSWGDSIHQITDTSFALMFLARAGAPVAVAKLCYPDATGKPAPDWNQRPRDVANAAEWMSARWGRELRWEALDLAGPAADLDDAPVLYVSGSRTPLAFAPADLAKLKAYVAGGGLIVGNPDGGSRTFTQSFAKLGLTLYPNLLWRPLPANHPIFTNPLYPASAWRAIPAAQGLSDGTRELMILLPASDPGRLMQNRSALPETFELPADIYLYQKPQAAPATLPSQPAGGN